jgi:VRR-NUC domain
VNDQALVPVLGPSEARRLTDEIKRDAEALWGRLVELYDGGAHTALGYSSWQAYCETEFGFGRSHAYRLLDAGRVAASIPQLGNEAQARELAPLLRDEGENGVAEVWREVRAEHGEQLTAEKVRTAVEKKLAPKPATPLTGAERSLGVEHVTEKQFMAAVVEMAQMLGWLSYHTHDSRRSEAGFPDIVCVRRDRVLFIELKTEKGRLSEEQERWLSALGLAGADVHCWRPSDWPAIEETLR